MFDKNNYKSYVSGQASWMQDIANQYGGSPYARLVEMGKAAQKDGVIKGILFHQGETDAGNSGWANKVKAVYDNLVKDLSLDAAKTPFLAGDLLSPSAGVQNLPKTLPNSYVISSQGLKGRDQWHFVAESYREFGKRYGAKMLDLLRKQGITGVAEGRANTGYALGNGVEFKNGISSFSFEIPQRTFVILKAYTLSGKEIAQLACAEYAEGKHVLEFGHKVVPTGVFVLKMKAGSIFATRTIVVGVQ
jgi:hypothetical protein